MNYKLDKEEDLIKIMYNLKEVLVMLGINCLPDQVPLPLSYTPNNDN